MEGSLLTVIWFAVQLRMHVGGRGLFSWLLYPAGLGLDIWRYRSLRLTDKARAVLFPTAKVWGYDETLISGVGEEESVSSGDEASSKVAINQHASSTRDSNLKGRNTDRKQAVESDPQKVGKKPQHSPSNAEQRFMIHELNLTGAEVNSFLFAPPL